MGLIRFVDWVKGDEDGWTSLRVELGFSGEFCDELAIADVVDSLRFCSEKEVVEAVEAGLVALSDENTLGAR